MKTNEELNLNKNLSGLNENALNHINGGILPTPKVITDDNDENTKMFCSTCNHSITWAGNYFQQLFDCPECGQHTFKGIEILY